MPKLDLESEMPFAWEHRVYDEDKLESTREHTTSYGIKESNNAFYEGFDGEEMIIVSWKVQK